MDLEKIVDEIKHDVEKLKEDMYEQKENFIKNKFELRELIASAVKEGNQEVLSIVQTHSEKIAKLENEKATTALKQKKYILVGVSAYFLSQVLSNLPYICKALSEVWK